MNIKISRFLQKWEPILFFIFLLFVSFVFYGDFIYMNPRFNHLWAQTDRMCLALGFVENGLNFFKPQVCNLGISDGTVGVEFPILFYIAAIFMKIFNTDSPFFVRFFSLIMSLAGLTAIFNIFRLLKINLYLSIFGIIIVYFSPIFFFYQANFNPNHFGFGLASIAIYYVVKYNYSREFNKVFLFYLFATLATLTKASYGLYFFSGTIYIYYLNGMNYEKIFKQSLFFIGGIVINIAYFGYNIYLNKIHGSYFFTINIESYDNFFQFLWDSGHVLSFWFKDIIFFWHWILIVLSILFIGTFSNILITKKKFIFGALIFFGSMSVYYLMGKQYMIHDYYFIDVFYIPLSLLLVCVFYKIQFIIKNQVLISIISCLFIIISTISGMEFFENRTTLKMDNRGDWITRDFEGAHKVIDKLGIPKNEKLLIFDPFCPDGILYFLKRKGSGINFLNPNELKAWQQKGFKFVVMQNLSITEYPDRYAEGLPILDLVFSDNRFKVFKIKS